MFLQGSDAATNSSSTGGGGGGGGSSASTGLMSRGSSRSRSSEEPHIGKYKLLKTIGKGNFAKVKLAKHVPTGKEVNRNTRVTCFKIYGTNLNSLQFL